MGKAVLFALFATLASAADVVTSAASPQVATAGDALVSLFGNNLSTVTQPAPGPPWPTMFGDIPAVTVTDAANNKVNAQILYLSATQMNLYIPPGLATGGATLTFPFTGLPPGVGTAAQRIVAFTLQKVAPGLFSANGTGSGVAAATAVQVVIPTQIQSPVTVFACTSVDGCQPVTIQLGVDTPIYVSFYGTGIRNAKNVSVKMGNVTVQPSYAGPQPETPGLDQVNVPLPLTLRNAGLIDVTVTADGITSNAVQIRVQ
jgi:uncharacterized protein (TIGR03437 family)